MAVIAADIIARLDAPATLGPKEADDFGLACGKARAEAIDSLLVAVVDERGWILSDDHVLLRVRVEHDGPVRARIVIDDEPVTPWWEDRVRTEGDVQHWSFEPVAEP